MPPVEPLSNASVHVITSSISKAELSEIAKETFEVMVKAVVDVEKRIMAVGGELHADANAVLLERGSRPQDLWGINLYPGKSSDWIEYIALINLKPAAGNRSMQIKDPALRKRIEEIVSSLIP
ncbi:MAG TPA: DUF5674 family protein [Terriglobales bacterium]|nr:DUF5674 family protein [Terriglobales bacterium]